MLTPPVVDGHYVEGETSDLGWLEQMPPAVIFGDAEVSPVLTPARNARVWSYGDLFTVAFRASEQGGRVHVRVQSQKLALWTGHAEWISAVRMIGEELGVNAWKTTRVDLAVDVEGLDVRSELLPYFVGHRGSVDYKGKPGGGRQIEIGNRAGSKRFLRLYVKTAMDCSVYMPTWIRQGYGGGRVVRVEVEFKNGGLPSRDPDWYSCEGQVRALYGDAVKRYRVATTINTRRSRSDTHPAWIDLCADAVKWMEPPDPVWLWRQRFELSRKKASRALGSLAGRIRNPWYEMEELDETLELLRGIQNNPNTPSIDKALSSDDFDAAREATLKREALLEQFARTRRGPRPKRADLDAITWDATFKRLGIAVKPRD